MNRVALFMGPVDWQLVRVVGELAARVRSPGDLGRVLAALFPEHSPYARLPDHLKIGNTPEAALAVLVDGLRDALNAALEDENGGPDVAYRLVKPGE